LLELGDFFDFLVEFHVGALLHEFTDGFEWLALFMLNEFKWVVAIGKVISVVVVVVAELDSLRLDQIVVH